MMRTILGRLPIATYTAQPRCVVSLRLCSHRFSANSKLTESQSQPTQRRSRNILDDELDEENTFDRSEPPQEDTFDGVTGHSSVIDKADFAHARVGDVLEIPYEVTASDFWRETWQSVFYQQDRIHTSLNYCNSLKRGLPPDAMQKNIGIPMPFSQVLYAATTMAHVDDTRNVLDLAYRNCVYERCVFPGDTLTRNFVIENIRESSNKKHVLIDLKCKLHNQANDLVFRVDKTMFFEKLALDPNFRIAESSRKGITPSIDTRFSDSSVFKKYILTQGSKVMYGDTSQTTATIKRVYKGELLLHTLQRPIGVETNMNLSMLHRMTHPLLYNTNRSSLNDLYVSGSLLIAMTHSIASKELYEVIYEELLDSHLINKASPNDCISAMTYIIDNNSKKYEFFEEVECITIGCKNLDITNDLKNIKVPLSLFRPGIFPRDVEDICNKFIPQLKNKIVVHSYRKLLRHKPKQDTYIPLL